MSLLLRMAEGRQDKGGSAAPRTLVMDVILLLRELPDCERQRQQGDGAQKPPGQTEDAPKRPCHDGGQDSGREACVAAVWRSSTAAGKRVGTDHV